MRALDALKIPFKRSIEALRQIWTSRYGYQAVGKGGTSAKRPNYSSPKHKTPGRQLATFGSGRVWWILLVLILTFFLVRPLFLPGVRGNTGSSLQQHHFLRLLFPSAEPDSEACKTVLTAGILGYPTPTVINYDKVFDEARRQPERDFQRTKLLYDHLSKFPSNRDEDIVILLDSPYSWLQLRPDVLLSRYYGVVNDANERLQKTMGRQTLVELEIEDSLVFSVQNSCQSPTKDDKTCSPVPVSPFKDVEKLVSLRYLSVGMIIGPLGKLRSFFEHAKSYAYKTTDNVSLQVIAEEAFGKQGYQREMQKLQQRSILTKIWHLIGKPLGYAHPIRHQFQKGAVADDRETSYEFGITLDYANQLGLTVTEDSHDVEWLEHGPLSSLPLDIESSMPPFWTPTGKPNLLDRSWKHMSLLMDKQTGSIPAVVNLGWNRGSLFQIRRWTNLWMQAEAKGLFAHAVSIPRLPVTSVLESSKDVEHVFWDSEARIDQSGMQTVTGLWGNWSDLCDREETYQSFWSR